MWGAIRRGAATLQRRSRKVAVVSRDVEVATFHDLEPFLYWGSDAALLRLHLAPELVRIRGAFGVHRGWNPFAAVLEEGEAALRRFYAKFQPKYLTDYYLLAPLGAEPGAQLAPNVIPWIVPDGLLHTRTTLFHGPGTPQEVEREIRRTLALRRSVKAQGYRPDLYGDVMGYFLKRGREFRFLVKGGSHRAAVACALGLAPLPVVLRPNWPRLVDLDQLHSWPMVRSGDVSARLAEAVFSRYFDFDGTQQRAAIT